MSVRRLFVWLFAIALFTMAVRETLDPDMWWHLRTGEAILNSGIPQQDIFSFTVSDHAWVTHEWLSQVVMWMIYSVGGLPGLIVVFALLIALTFWLVYVVSVGRPYLPAFVTLLAAFASAIVWGARPQIFNMLFTAVFVFITERYRQQRVGARLLWLLPVLMVIWANLHSGYLLGVVLLGTYAVGWGIERWSNPHDVDTPSWTDVRRMLGVTVLSFLAAALNPSGPELWIYPFLTLGSRAMQVYIQEWHSPDFHQPYFWPFAALLGAGILSWVFSRKRPSATDLLLFLGTGFAGLLSARHIPLFAIVSVPIVSRYMVWRLHGTQFAALVEEAPRQIPQNRLFSIVNGVVLAAALLASFIWTANTLLNNDQAIMARYPVTAVDYLEQSGLAEERGYNSYNWGGYLIWRGLPVFVDGRADVYGDAFLFYYLQAFEVNQNWEEPLREFDVSYVIMERGSPLLNLLAASGEWQEAYQDDVAQIFVRQTE